MLKSKRTIAFLMAAAMAASVSITAFADTETTGTEVTENGGTGETIVNYTPPVKYTVTIPALVTLQDSEDTEAVISVSDVTIESDKKLTVSIDSASKLTVSNGSAKSPDELNYTIKIGDEEKTAGNVLFSVVSDDIISEEPIKKTLLFSPPQSPKYADEYKGSLTFKVSYTSKGS